MESENPYEATTFPHHRSLRIWFEILTLDLANIKKCMDDNSSIQITRLNFDSALHHLKLGWAMISEKKSESPPSHEAQSEGEMKWWQKDQRFTEFARLASEEIWKACQERNIPLKKEANLSTYLRQLVRILRRLPTHQFVIYNPHGWENFKIANELFAKSICQMIGYNHRYLSTTEHANLSHLLAHLQHTLGQVSSCASL